MTTNTFSNHSGPNHHFLPRLLQRGFASRKRGKNPFVWRFHRDGSVVEERIARVGADPYFYGHPSESSVDEHFKAKENEFGECLARLRKATTSQVVGDLFVPEFFVHMAVRTRNLRDAFGNTTNELMKRMVAINGTPDAEAYFKRLAHDAVEDEKAKLLTEEPYRTLLAQMPSEERDRLLAQVDALGGALAPTYGPTLGMIMKMIDFRSLTGPAHVKALGRIEGGVPKRIEALKPLTWSLIVQSDGDFILGDIAVIVQADESGPLQSPLKEKGTPYAMFLPISDRHLLAGSRNGPMLDADPEVINCGSAELSMDFFIASQHTDRERNYLARLSRRSGLLTSEEIGEITRDIVQGQ